jgi:hypothetical protein
VTFNLALVSSGNPFSAPRKFCLSGPFQASDPPDGERGRNLPDFIQSLEVILGRERLSVDKGKKRKVKVSMTGKGRSMVQRRKKLKVTAKLVVNQGGKTHVSTTSLTIKAPRSR